MSVQRCLTVLALVLIVAAPALSAAALPPNVDVGSAGQAVAAALPARVVSLWGGARHGIALQSDGTVWAWGCNNPGPNGVGNFELGDGTNLDRATPGPVNGLSQVVAIAARDYHNYALKADGTVWAWGFNENGQLGDNTTIDRNIPVQVLFPSAPFMPTAWLYLPLLSR